MDLIGIEPMTSSMPWKRAPSCATGPRTQVGCNFSIVSILTRFVKPARPDKKPPASITAKRCVFLAKTPQILRENGAQ